jgi:hypothetical protein
VSLTESLGNQSQLTLVVDAKRVDQALVVSAGTLDGVTNAVSVINVPRLSASNQRVLVITAGLFFDGTCNTVLVLGNVISVNGTPLVTISTQQRKIKRKVNLTKIIPPNRYCLINTPTPPDFQRMRNFKRNNKSVS